MPAEFTEGTGFFVREPSWHKLEGALLDDWPGSWAEARDLAKLHWEPEIVPVATVEKHYTPDGMLAGTLYHPVSDWNGIRRSDDKKLLSIQPDSYKVINNTEFGKFIEIILGETDVLYEALFELYGGKKVCCLVRFPEVRKVTGDPSAFYTYLAVVSRHDGSGGLKASATNVRMQCANTERMIDVAGKEGKDSWTIRHTANWGDRIEEVAASLQGLFDGQQPYYELASNLNITLLAGNDYQGSTTGRVHALQHSVKDVIIKYLPIGDDMSLKQQENRLTERQQVEDNYYSESCEGIRGTYWGVYQAYTEWVDHQRTYRSMTSYTDRQLSPSPMKRRALRITKKLAGV